MSKILHVVGARPNFMKAAPAIAALAEKGFRQVLVHTGQHYDAAMSDVFFRQLGMPQPDYNLEVGSGSHAVQTANIMTRFEEVVLKDRPDLVLVYGDVNSTVASTLVCAKLGIRVGHVEAGLRSFDRTMPEEINRVVTDQLADLLFTPSEDGNRNLEREGIAREKIHLVGNLMIDTLVRLLPSARRPELPGLNGDYILVTLHRPSNVDPPDRLRQLFQTLTELSREVAVVFPVHPRTRQRLADLGLGPDGARLRLVEPLGYLEFLALQRDARVAATDSGGVQEETTYFGVHCVTVRSNPEPRSRNRRSADSFVRVVSRGSGDSRTTLAALRNPCTSGRNCENDRNRSTERPITVEMGTNHLGGENLSERCSSKGRRCRARTAPPATRPRNR